MSVGPDILDSACPTARTTVKGLENSPGTCSCEHRPWVPLSVVRCLLKSIFSRLISLVPDQYYTRVALCRVCYCRLLSTSGFLSTRKRYDTFIRCCRRVGRPFIVTRLGTAVNTGRDTCRGTMKVDDNNNYCFLFRLGRCCLEHCWHPQFSSSLTSMYS